MQLRVGTKRIYRGSDWASWSNKLRQPARLFPLLIFPHFFLVFFVRMLEDFQSSCSRSKKKKEKNRNEESSRVGKERERRSVLPIVTKDKERIKEEKRKSESKREWSTRAHARPSNDSTSFFLTLVLNCACIHVSPWTVARWSLFNRVTRMSRDAAQSNLCLPRVTWFTALDRIWFDVREQGGWKLVIRNSLFLSFQSIFQPILFAVSNIFFSVEENGGKERKKSVGSFSNEENGWRCAISIGERARWRSDGGSTNFANLSDPGFRIHVAGAMHSSIGYELSDAGWVVYPRGLAFPLMEVRVGQQTRSDNAG